MSFHRRYALRGFFGGDSSNSLLNAEESSFGNSDVTEEYGLTPNGNPSVVSVSGKYASGVCFTAKENISLVGLRTMATYGSRSKTMRLWNGSGELVCETASVSPAANAWGTVYFAEPVAIAKGETFTVSTSRYSDPAYYTLDQVSFNEKLTFNGSDYSDATSYFNCAGTSKVYGIIDCIIAIPEVELPDEYQVARTTMDGIANEVKRITGTTGKLTTEQIITALEGVTV